VQLTNKVISATRIIWHFHRPA